MPHGIIFILDVLHGFNANIEMLTDEILRDDFVGFLLFFAVCNQGPV